MTVAQVLATLAIFAIGFWSGRAWEKEKNRG